MCQALSKERKGKTIEELWGNEKANQMRVNYKTRRRRSSPTDLEIKEISDRIKRASKERPWTRHFEKNQLPKGTCPHCSKTMDIGNLTRHHNDKCKLRKSSI